MTNRSGTPTAAGTTTKSPGWCSKGPGHPGPFFLQNRKPLTRRAGEPARQCEHDVPGDALERAHALRAEGLQARDQLLDQHLGRGRPGSDADAALARDPLRPQGRSVVDEVRGHAHVLGYLAQAIRVRAVGRADHDYHVALRRHELDRVLAVLRGVADIVFFGPDDAREAVLQRG